MKFCMLLLMLLGTAVVMHAQTDTVGQRQQPAVVDPDDPEIQAVPDVSKEDRVEVEKRELPEPLRNKLESDAQYDGWEDGTVYLEKNTNEYLLHIRQENATQTYRFDEFGNALDDTVPADEPGERSKK